MKRDRQKEITKIALLLLLIFKIIVQTNEIWWWIISDDINYTVRDEIVSGKE